MFGNNVEISPIRCNTLNLHVEFRREMPAGKAVVIARRTIKSIEEKGIRTKKLFRKKEQAQSLNPSVSEMDVEVREDSDHIVPPEWMGVTFTNKTRPIL
jgi:hypothetical protein